MKNKLSVVLTITKIKKHIADVGNMFEEATNEKIDDIAVSVNDGSDDKGVRRLLRECR